METYIVGGTSALRTTPWPKMISVSHERGRYLEVLEKINEEGMRYLYSPFLTDLWSFLYRDTSQNYPALPTPDHLSIH